MRRGEDKNVKLRVTAAETSRYYVGFIPSGGRLAAALGRHRFREPAILEWYIVRNWYLPGKKRIVPYSIQTLKRLKPAQFRDDWITLLGLLFEQKIEPVITQRYTLLEARRTHELLGKGGVIGKIVLVMNGASIDNRASG